MKLLLEITSKRSNICSGGTMTFRQCKLLVDELSTASREGKSVVTLFMSRSNFYRQLNITDNIP